MSAPAKKTLRIGVLYEEAQMSDLIGLDVLNNLSVKTMELFADMLPASKALAPFAVPMEFLYISSTLDHAWYVRSTFGRSSLAVNWHAIHDHYTH